MKHLPNLFGNAANLGVGAPLQVAHVNLLVAIVADLGARIRHAGTTLIAW